MIAASLGATVAQLDYMIGLKAGVSRLRGTEGVTCDARGWTHHPHQRRELTEAGEGLVARARKLGY